MGMFDWVNYKCECPVCEEEVKSFQSKDGECNLIKIEPESVDNFYSLCDKCECWIEFNKRDEGLYDRHVESRDSTRKRLHEHAKVVRIPS